MNEKSTKTEKLGCVQMKLHAEPTKKPREQHFKDRERRWEKVTLRKRSQTDPLNSKLQMRDKYPSDFPTHSSNHLFNI